VRRRALYASGAAGPRKWWARLDAVSLSRQRPRRSGCAVRTAGPPGSHRAHRRSEPLSGHSAERVSGRSAGCVGGEVLATGRLLIQLNVERSALRISDDLTQRLGGRRLAQLLARRLSEFKPAEPHYDRGYGKLFLEHVTQADQGCDFDFLRGSSGAATARPRAAVPTQTAG
jgi:hypothetical protein